MLLARQRAIKPDVCLDNFVQYNASNLISPHTHDPRHALQLDHIQSEIDAVILSRVKVDDCPCPKSIPARVVDPIEPLTILGFTEPTES